VKSIVLIVFIKVREDPEMSSSVLGLVSFPEMRIHRQVVTDRVLPLVVVRREVWVPVAVDKTTTLKQ
jgi:hypothetical protein